MTVCTVFEFYFKGFSHEEKQIKRRQHLCFHTKTLRKRQTLKQKNKHTLTLSLCSLTTADKVMALSNLILLHIVEKSPTWTCV